MTTLTVLTLVCSFLTHSQPSTTRISVARKSETGILIHEVRSPLQKGITKIRVLLPTALKKNRRYPVIYVLPVEAKDGSRYGDSLHEIQKLDLANKFDVIFVALTFSHLPWYADHPTDKTIQQESYFVETVVPTVEKTYPVIPERKGRLLLGFSKSGWGAFTLLLRHPETFERAAAWDAPMMMKKSGRFGSGPVFGSQKNFEKYQVSELLKKTAPSVRNQKRLALLGTSNFTQDHKLVHQRLTDLKIPHYYQSRKLKKHTWNAGWLEEGTRFLMESKP